MSLHRRRARQPVSSLGDTSPDRSTPACSLASSNSMSTPRALDLAISCLLFVAAPVLSAPLGLDAALERAANTHPRVAQRLAEVRAAESDQESARWGRFPSLSAESTRLEAGGAQTILRVQQPLWTGGRITAQIETADKRHAAAVEDVALARQNLQLETAAAFAELWRGQMREEAARRNVVEHERLYEMIERRVASEISPKSDATLAAARLQQARTEAIQAGAQAASARANLAQLVGETDFTLEAPQRLPSMTLSLPDATAEALAQAPELALLQARIDAATAEIGVNRAALLPQLVVGHEQRLGSLLPGQSRDFTYVALQYQPGAGLSAASATQAAVARAEGSRDAHAAARRQLEQQVAQEWNLATALRAQLPQTAQLVNATREVVESYMRQYTVGRKSWIDVLNAQREVTQALYSQADARAGALSSIVRLRILAGMHRPQAGAAEGPQ